METRTLLVDFLPFEINHQQIQESLENAEFLKEKKIFVKRKFCTVLYKILINTFKNEGLSFYETDPGEKVKREEINELKLYKTDKDSDKKETISILSIPEDDLVILISSEVSRAMASMKIRIKPSIEEKIKLKRKLANGMLVLVVEMIS